MKAIRLSAIIDSIRASLDSLMALRNQCEEPKKKRSLQQNAYYWGVVVQKIIEAHDDQYKPYQIHEWLKRQFLAEIIELRGVIHEIGSSTAVLSTKQFEEFMSNVRMWAAENGIDIPEPNEGER